MNRELDLIETLAAKDAIRELVLLYCRGCDRKDFALLRSLYTSDATDSHDETFDGPAEAYVDFLERSLPHARYSGHHVCNHLISVDPRRGEGEGEVYALAWHVFANREGNLVEDFMCCRYIDRYRNVDGRWCFAKRVVRYDLRTVKPYTPVAGGAKDEKDVSYSELASAVFMRGRRA